MKTAISNVLILVGMGLTLYGVARFSVPTAYIIGGLIVMVIAVNLARRK